MRNTPATTCTAEGCNREVRARDLCLMHYKRFMKYGSTTGIESPYGRRPDDVKAYRAKYARWERFYEIEHTWKDAQHFFETVGEPPEKYMSLHKIDDCKPIGPDNFKWGKCKRDFKKTLGRKSMQESNLFKFYGVDLETYNRMLKEQNSVCAICRCPESAKRNGKLLALSVDHCHASNKVRGLLCANCNRALGLFKDEVQYLQRAVEYLRRQT